MYTGRSSPDPTPAEFATREDFSSLQDPIRIKRLKPPDPSIQLTTYHRLCYSEIYEVKYDVMARAFGEVERTSRWSLKPQAKELIREMRAEMALPPGLFKQASVLSDISLYSQHEYSSGLSEDEQERVPARDSMALQGVSKHTVSTAIPLYVRAS